MGFYGYLAFPYILPFELLALFHDLSFAWDHGCCVVECFSDSFEGVSLVSYVPSECHTLAPLIWDIKDLL